MAEELNQRINDEYNNVSKRILASNGKLDEESLRYLKEILEIKEKLKPKRNIPKRIYIVLLAVSFVVCGFLVSCDVKKMNVEFTVEVSGVTFETSKAQQITKEIYAQTLEIQGNTQLTFPRIKENEYKEIVFEKVINLSQSDAKSQVTLEPLSAPMRTTFNFDVETENRLVLVLTPPAFDSVDNFSAKVALAGGVRVSGTIQGELERINRIFNIGYSRSAHLESIKKDPLIFFIDFKESFPDIFIPEIAVSALDFSMEKIQRVNSKTESKSISTLLSGTYKTEFMEKDAYLRKSQWMSFDSVKGDISISKTKKGNYEVRFDGDVKGMSLRKGGNQSSIMPSYLEWLYQKNELNLLWGTALWLFTLLLGGVKWLKD